MTVESDIAELRSAVDRLVAIDSYGSVEVDSLKRQRLAALVAYIVLVVLVAVAVTVALVKAADTTTQLHADQIATCVSSNAARAGERALFTDLLPKVSADQRAADVKLIDSDLADRNCAVVIKK